MAHYLDLLHASPVAEPGVPVCAPGDKEWEEALQREQLGIPVDPDTEKFLGLSH